MLRLTTLIFALSPIVAIAAEGNTSNQSFNKAKKNLERYVYNENRETLYCGAAFDEKKNVIIPTGFETAKHVKRAMRIEWEHVVPAENFGRTFVEWREGHPECVSSKGKQFKGRKCAEKVNAQYRYMQADMYNLFPAIGAVNATRSNYNFTMLPGEESSFGSCAMKISGNKVEPPVEARGRIARTYLYMETVYPSYKMSSQQKKLMNAWDNAYPVSQWECKRNAKIEAIQSNKNTILLTRCARL